MATYWENSCSFGLRYVSWYKYLIVSLVFSHLGFWSGNLFLIAPFPDLCLLVPFYKKSVWLSSISYRQTDRRMINFSIALLFNLLAGVSDGFSRGSPVFAPPTDWPLI